MLERNGAAVVVLMESRADSTYIVATLSNDSVRRRSSGSNVENSSNTEAIAALGVVAIVTAIATAVPEGEVVVIQL